MDDLFCKSEWHDLLSNTVCSNMSTTKPEVQLALSDLCCMQILSSISKKSMTVNDISAKVGFCKSRVYRKIRMLKNANLVRVSGDISHDGCKRFRYLSKMNPSVYLEKGGHQDKTFPSEVKSHGT